MKRRFLKSNEEEIKIRNIRNTEIGNFCKVESKSKTKYILIFDPSILNNLFWFEHLQHLQRI